MLFLSLRQFQLRAGLASCRDGPAVAAAVLGRTSEDMILSFIFYLVYTPVFLYIYPCFDFILPLFVMP
jgi:hypothetical protein